MRQSEFGQEIEEFDIYFLSFKFFTVNIFTQKVTFWVRIMRIPNSAWLHYLENPTVLDGVYENES